MGFFYGLSAIYAITLAPVFLLGLAIPYAILRVRDAQMERRDDQVGIKAGLYFFLSLAVYLILGGSTVIAIDLTKEKTHAQPQPEAIARMLDANAFEALRFGGALIVSGALLLAVHFALIRFMTNDARFPATRHVFNGWRFAISGFVVMITFTSLVVFVFQKDIGTIDPKRAALATLFVWCPAWLIDLALLVSRRKLPYCSTRRIPETPVEPVPSSE
jgi:hypothetical protein